MSTGLSLVVLFPSLAMTLLSGDARVVSDENEKIYSAGGLSIKLLIVTLLNNNSYCSCSVLFFNRVSESKFELHFGKAFWKTIQNLHPNFCPYRLNLLLLMTTTL